MVGNWPACGGHYGSLPGHHNELTIKNEPLARHVAWLVGWLAGRGGERGDICCRMLRRPPGHVFFFFFLPFVHAGNNRCRFCRRGESGKLIDVDSTPSAAGPPRRITRAVTQIDSSPDGASEEELEEEEVMRRGSRELPPPATIAAFRRGAVGVGATCGCAECGFDGEPAVHAIYIRAREDKRGVKSRLGRVCVLFP